MYLEKSRCDKKSRQLNTAQLVELFRIMKLSDELTKHIFKFFLKPYTKNVQKFINKIN